MRLLRARLVRVLELEGVGGGVDGAALVGAALLLRLLVAKVLALNPGEVLVGASSPLVAAFRMEGVVVEAGGDLGPGFVDPAKGLVLLALGCFGRRSLLGRRLLLALGVGVGG